LEDVKPKRKRPQLGGEKRKETIGTTEKGKEIQVVATGLGTYKLEFTTGGMLPKMLQGTFSLDGANRAVQAYTES